MPRRHADQRGTGYLFAGIGAGSHGNNRADRCASATPTAPDSDGATSTHGHRSGDGDGNQPGDGYHAAASANRRGYGYGGGNAHGARTNADGHGIFHFTGGNGNADAHFYGDFACTDGDPVLDVDCDSDCGCDSYELGDADTANGNTLHDIHPGGDGDANAYTADADRYGDGRRGRR